MKITKCIPSANLDFKIIIWSLSAIYYSLLLDTGDHIQNFDKMLSKLSLFYHLDLNHSLHASSAILYVLLILLQNISL